VAGKIKVLSRNGRLFLALACLLLLECSCEFDRRTVSLVFPREEGVRARVFQCEALVMRPIQIGEGEGDAEARVTVKWSAPSLPVHDFDGDGEVNLADAERAVAHLVDAFIESQFGSYASQAEVISVSVSELPEPFQAGTRGVSLQNLPEMKERFKNNLAGFVVGMNPSTGEARNTTSLRARVRGRVFTATTGVAEGLLELSIQKRISQEGEEREVVLINGLYARFNSFSALLGNQVVEVTEMALTASEPIILAPVAQTGLSTKRPAIWQLAGGARGLFLSWKANGESYGQYIDLEEEILTAQVNFIAGPGEIGNPAFQLDLGLPARLFGIPDRKGQLEIRAQGHWINRAPIAWAGSSMVVEAETMDGTALIELNGSGTVDYDNDELLFIWIKDYQVEGKEKFLSNQRIVSNLELGMGIHTFTLIASDSLGTLSSHTIEVKVQPKAPLVSLLIDPDVIYVLPEEMGQMEQVRTRCRFRPSTLPVTSLQARVCGESSPKKKLGGFDVQLNGDPIYGQCGETTLNLREPILDLQLRKRLSGSSRRPKPFLYRVELRAQDGYGTVGVESRIVLMSPPSQE